MSYSQYSQYGGNPYNNAPAAEGGYVAPPTTLQPGHPGLNHEMSNYSQASDYSGAAATPGPGYNAASTAYGAHAGQPLPQAGVILSRQDFLTRVEVTKEQIRDLTTSINQIQTLHQRALSSPDSSSSAQLESLVSQTQIKNGQIKDAIKFLEADATKTTDGTKNMKATQARQLKNDFERELTSYQQAELAYRQRYREQIARQYRIVNPDATDSEVREASELDWGSEGVFQTALKSNRTGQASSVLGAVRARHNELQRIEQTLTELAAMFADMAQIVEAQDPIVQHTEENAIKTADDVDRGNTEIQKANEHARRRNKLRRWCIFIVVLIILAIALGVGLGVGLTKAN